MNFTSMQNLILDSLANYSVSLVAILTAVIAIGLAYLVFRFGWRLVKGETVTNIPWLDRMTYKPWKGYNRLRSRKWNLEHTAS